jgi:putative endonuclease
MERTYSVYILASRSRRIYTGVTNDLNRRAIEHRQGVADGYTKRYRIHRLVYFETFGDVRDAIAREKQIKGLDRAKRVALIEAKNPAWQDYAESWLPRLPRKADPSLRS